jgi:hypothetical protein
MSSPAPWADAKAKLIAANLVAADHIEWPNEPFVAPDSDLWLSVDITGDVLRPIEIGGGVWQEEGSLYVHVHVPSFSGTDDARTMAKNIANVFRLSTPQFVTYLGASIGIGSISDPEGKWWTLSVRVDWVYQDVLV